MKKIFLLIVALALLVGLLPTAAFAQTTPPVVELTQLDAMFGSAGYLCYPDTSSGTHVKVQAWPRNTPVVSPLLRVEQPYETYEVGTQPQSGVVSDAWLDSPLSTDARANCPSIPSDGAGDVRNLRITRDEVQSGIGDGEYSCFSDRRDGVHIIVLAKGVELAPPFTHMDHSKGVLPRGELATEPLEGTGWLQGQIDYVEWKQCDKWQDPKHPATVVPAVSGALPPELVAFVNLFLQWLQAGGYTFPALPVAPMAPAATITPTVAPTATLTPTETPVPPTVAARLHMALGTADDGTPIWSCFTDRHDSVLVLVWPDGVAIPDFVGLANTPSGDMVAGEVPSTGDRVTLWLVDGLEVDALECPGA